MADDDLKESRLSGREVFRGSFLRVQRDEVCLPDGGKASREFILHPGAVVILPLFDDETVLVERQFRYPLKQVFVEFPAGKIDAGETWLESARRELKEETGYHAGRWQHLCTIHNAIAYADEHLELFLARDLTPGSPALDQGEFLETFRLPAAALIEMVRRGEITDVKTVIGIFWLEKILSGAWQPES